VQIDQTIVVLWVGAVATPTVARPAVSARAYTYVLVKCIAMQALLLDWRSERTLHQLDWDSLSRLWLRRLLPIIAVKHRAEAEGCEIFVPTFELLIGFVGARCRVLVAGFVVRLATRSIGLGEVCSEVLQARKVLRCSLVSIDSQYKRRRSII
jgi:hypothetical protein